MRFHFTLICFAVAAFGLYGSAKAQEADQTRRLAPGVMQTVRPFVNYSETYQWASIPSIVAKDDSYDWAADLYFSKSIWCLELKFKPVRVIEVDFPNENGTMDRKNVWYMVYSVTNTGKFLESAVAERAKHTISIMKRKESGGIEPEAVEDIDNNIKGTYKPEIVDYLDRQPDENGKIPGTVRFVPRFVLVGYDLSGQFTYIRDDTGEYKGDDIKKIGRDAFFRLETPDGGLYFSEQHPVQSTIYADRFLPLAHAQIAAAEDPNQDFENSVTLPALDIAPGKTVWGIATWVDIDSRVDRFTVYISGLTNALRWVDNGEAFDPEAPPMAGREILRKVLKLNFFRPGDEYGGTDDLFYFGKPGEQKYEWIFL